MKAKLLLLASLIFLSHSPWVHATNDKAAYHDVRYKSYICNSGKIKLTVDMANVSTVKFDANVHSAVVYFSGTSINPVSDPTEFSNNWWLYMKNGKTHRLGACEQVNTDFNAYLTFLKNNPQFMNVQ